MVNPKNICVFVLVVVNAVSSNAQNPNPTGILSLEQAAALALEHSPSLQVFPWDVRAAEARALQASLRPNPVVSFEVENIRLSGGPDDEVRGAGINGSGVSLERRKSSGGASGFEEADFTFRVSQLFLLGGKRAKAIAVAERDKAAAEWDYEIGRTNVLRDVARAYVSVLADQDHVAEQRQIVELAETVEATIGARADAGKVSAIEQKRAAVQTASARIELVRAERHLEGARVELAATWGSFEPAFDEVSGELHTATALPTLPALLERSATNPDIQQWQYEIARRDSAIELANAGRVPDLTASLGFATRGVEDFGSRTIGVGPSGPFFSRSSTRFDDGRNNRVEFEISIPLPLFSRNQGNIREAQHLRAKAEYERRSALAKAKSELAHWHEVAVAAYEEIVLLNEEALPNAGEASESVQIGFNEGKFGYLDVLDTQRTLFGLEGQLHDAYSAYHLAVVEIERLLGEPLWSSAEIFGTSIQENVHETN